MRLLFFGDGAWATRSLERLHAEGRTPVGVVVRTAPTDPDLERRARELGLPVLQPPDVNAPELLDRVRGLAPDLNLSVSYDQLLRAEIRGAAPLGFVNVHAGRLPEYRGRSVVTWAILNGETEIGLTAHFVDAGIDTGDILLQRTLPIEWEDDYAAVLAKVTAATPDLVLDTVRVLERGEAEPVPQAHLPGTYFPRRRPGDEWLDWSRPSADVYNQIRALARPGVGARTLLGERVVTLWRACYDPAWPKYRATPGEVVGRPDGPGVMVKTGDATVRVLEAEVEGGAPAAPDWRIGTRLGVDLPAAVHRLAARVAALEARLAGPDPTHTTEP